jgi:hypothetical protein
MGPQMTLSPFLNAAARGTIWSPTRLDKEVEYLQALPFFQMASHSVQQRCLHIEGTLAFKQLETGRVQSLAIRME